MVPPPLPARPQILEWWDPAVWSRQLDVVEAAIKFGAQDTTAESRQAARAAFAQYMAALPDRAQAFLRKQEQGLQDKLGAQAAGGNVSGKVTGRCACGPPAWCTCTHAHAKHAQTGLALV